MDKPDDPARVEPTCPEWAGSGNYIADREQAPHWVAFANGRTVAIAMPSGGEPYLVIGMEQPGERRLRAMAAAEDDAGSISVGGLAVDVGLYTAQPANTDDPMEHCKNGHEWSSTILCPFCMEKSLEYQGLANTDDRTADTIPDDLNPDYAHILAALKTEPEESKRVLGQMKYYIERIGRAESSLFGCQGIDSANDEGAGSRRDADRSAGGRAARGTGIHSKKHIRR